MNYLCFHTINLFLWLSASATTAFDINVDGAATHSSLQWPKCGRFRTNAIKADNRYHFPLVIPQPRRQWRPRLSTALTTNSIRGGDLDNDNGVNGVVNGVSSLVKNQTTESSSPHQFPKTQEEETFIRNALLQNVMFTDLPDSTFDQIVQAFEKTTVYKGKLIVTQGDASEEDYVYLVADGQCQVTVDGKPAPEPYGTLKKRTIFGEMGVLYDRGRAATVSAKSPTVTLFRIYGDTLMTLLNNFKLTSNEDGNPELLEQIDQAINEVAGTRSLYGGVIIRPYQSNSLWLWRQWKGTVFQHSCKSVLFNMLVSLGFIMLMRNDVFDTPIWASRLDKIRKIWSYQMSLTTFILTFFVNQAYTFWQSVYGIARSIQGRLNDFHLLLATSCTRNPDGSFTQESENLMDDISAYSRLFHALLWASCARRYNVLWTPKGLERLAFRGLLTSRQLRVLENLETPNNQKHHACLEWMLIRAKQGLYDGTLVGGDPLHLSLMDQICQLRGTYYGIGGKLSCRVPLPYTHFVQILVDSFVVLSSVALYAELGTYSIFSVGMLTLFYKGLLDLAKVFLDPLDNEDFTKHSIDMDVGVLIRESNAGSTIWKNSADTLPFDL